MLTRPSLAVLCSLMLIAATSTLCQAQEYTNKPIRIFTGPTGGGGDFQARTIGQGITVGLGQPVVIENRPNNLIGEMVAKAAPDRYTLILGGGRLWTLPLLQSTPYDAVRDFAPIIL